MGDGGVAYVPSQHVMERFPIPNMFCGGNGGFNSKSLQFAESQIQRKHEKKMEVEKEDFGLVKGRKRGAEKGELGLERGKLRRMKFWPTCCQRMKPRRENCV
uniref:Uncharacterized protein n=1 Tax=Nelumbo nucifera TaxID=4432 RepID=A0A822XGY4_NELNU|nr:TPA_asm: hypothetical protein HUJ06_019834 [Nelumbo nucifera]